MIQGVREVFEFVDMDSRVVQKGKDKERKGTEGKMVLIGRGLHEGAFGRSLVKSLESSL